MAFEHGTKKAITHEEKAYYVRKQDQKTRKWSRVQRRVVAVGGTDLAESMSGNRCWKIAGRVTTTKCLEKSFFLALMLISVTWLGASQSVDFVVLDLGDAPH